MDNRVCMVIDIDRCWGCMACEVACKQELDLGAGARPMLVINVGPREIDAKLHKDSIPTLCQHCDDPPCMEACPTGGIYQEADGSVQINAEKCNGCEACRPACPFGAIEESPINSSVVKCTLCFSRRQAGGVPSCAQHCVGRAFTMTNQSELHAVIGNRYSWTCGRVVYVSDKWASLGKSVMA